MSDPSITLVTNKAELVDATGAYLKFEKIEAAISDVNSCKNFLEEDNTDIIVICNTLNVRQVYNDLLKIRADTRYIVNPIVIFCEEVTDYLQELTFEAEYAELCTLPFDSNNYITSLIKSIELLESKREIFDLRREIHLLMKEKFDHKSALPLIDEFMQKSDNKYRAAILKAEAYEALKHLDKAKKACQAALDEHPNSFNARTLMATILQRRGELDKAQEFIEKSIEKTAEHVGYFVKVGDIKLCKGDVEGSKADFEQALALDEDSQAALTGKAAVDLIEGKIESVGEQIGGTFISNDLAKFNNLRGIQLTAAKRFDLAEKLYLNSMHFLHDDLLKQRVFFNLGLCMKKAGRQEKALEYFKECNATGQEPFPRANEQIDFLKAKYPQLAQKKAS